MKEPFFVKARFWRIPSDLAITFVYTINTRITEAISDAVRNSTPDHRDLALSFRQGKFDTISNTAIEDCHEILQQELNTNIVKQVNLHGSLSPKNYVALGSRPQGFYTIYVSNDDASKMQQRGYLIKARESTNTVSPGPLSSNLKKEVGDIEAEIKYIGPKSRTKTTISPKIGRAHV